MAPALQFDSSISATDQGKLVGTLGAPSRNRHLLAQTNARAATDERQTMKKQIIDFTEQQSLDTCVRQLEALLEGLKAGTLSLSQGGEKLWLRPGGAVDIELRAEQAGDRENLEIRLGWHRASLHVVSRPPEDGPPKTVRNWQKTAAVRDDVIPPSQKPLGVRNLDATSAARYQELYAASRNVDAEGRHHLDMDRFLHALAAAGIDAGTRHDLCEQAREAEGAGRASLFHEDVIAALRKAS